MQSYFYKMKDTVRIVKLLTFVTMRFKRLGTVQCTLVLLLLLDFLSLSVAQNCGVPKMITVNKDDALKETLDTGQLLTTIKVRNVVEIISVHQNPANFALAKLIEDEKSSELRLEVDEPLWRAESKSYIDKTRAACVIVTVKLKCEDGMSKDVTFEIPIKDENTQAPTFEFNNYSVSTEACLRDRCTLVFEQCITVIDYDRDEVNAQMNLWTDSPCVKMHPIQVMEDLGPYGYQIKVKLELLVGEKYNISNNVSFNLMANNAVPHADGINRTASAKVDITFVELPNRYYSPIFDTPVYYIYVYDTCSKHLKVHPYEIKTHLPGITDDSLITYNVTGGHRKVLKINSTNAAVQLDDTFNQDVIRNLSTSVLQFDIVAERWKRRNGSIGVRLTSTTASLIVFFPEWEYYQSPVTTNPKTCYPGPPKDCPTPTEDPHTSFPNTTDTVNATTIAPNITTLFPTSEERTDISTFMPNATTSNPNITTPAPTYITTTEHPSTTESINSTTTPFPNITSTSSPIPPPPDRPPDHCTCDCTQFSCSDSNIIGGFSYHADPYYCTKYHQCSRAQGGDVDQSTFMCPTETIFCPNMSECMTVDECFRRTGMLINMTHLPSDTKMGYEFSLTSKGDTVCGNWSCTCFNGIWPGEPANLCNESNYNELLEDPNHCDIFHQCQRMGEPDTHYFIDYPQRCPDGLIFCPDLKQCSYTHECVCNKTVKFCDVYVMGRWENFDIFNKTFRNNTVNSPVVA